MKVKLQNLKEGVVYRVEAGWVFTILDNLMIKDGGHVEEFKEGQEIYIRDMVFVPDRYRVNDVIKDVIRDNFQAYYYSRGSSTSFVDENKKYVKPAKSKLATNAFLFGEEREAYLVLNSNYVLGQDGCAYAVNKLGDDFFRYALKPRNPHENLLRTLVSGSIDLMKYDMIHMGEM